MNKSSFLKIYDVVRFVEDVFGERQPLEIEGGDSVMRNEGRRAEEVVSVRTFLESNSSDVLFSVTFFDDVSDAFQKLPEVFGNTDYFKVLRNRYRELKRTEISYWKIDYFYSRLVDGPEKGGHKITFSFTVRYGNEYD
ncbi:MAG TPA: hypothetical protein VJZ16_05945 [Syntrophales bacterium]|nr:hypothetical protein [Syntrophales bacterium]